MATITTRSGKGSALTHTEVDANFTNLNTDKAQIKRTEFDTTPVATQASISTSLDSNVYRYTFVIATLSYSLGPNNPILEIGRAGTYLTWSMGYAFTTGSDGQTSTTDLWAGLGSFQSGQNPYIIDIHKTTDKWVCEMRMSLGSSGYYLVTGVSSNTNRDYISNIRLGTGSTYNFTVLQGHLLEYS